MKAAPDAVVPGDLEAARLLLGCFIECSVRDLVLAHRLFDEVNGALVKIAGARALGVPVGTSVVGSMLIGAVARSLASHRSMQ